MVLVSCVHVVFVLGMPRFIFVSSPAPCGIQVQQVFNQWVTAGAF